MSKSTRVRQARAWIVSLFPVACLSLSLAMTAQPAAAQRMLLDKVVALVDEDVVLQSELDARMAEIRETAARNNQPVPDNEEFRTEILNALVIENLQMQFAERVSIRFDDDTVNRVLGNMAENSNMSFDEYVDALKGNGVYLQTREQVRKQMTLQELQRGMVNRRITITEQEIENFLNSETGREVMAADYLIDHMFVPTGSEEAPAITASKLKYAADLVARIQEGEPLGVVKQSERQAGSFEIDSTEFGWRKAGALPGLFSEIVADMSVGGVEGPIEAGNGFHIIQLVDKQGGTEQIVEQTNIRHIMLTPNEIRNEEQTLAAINDLRQRILDGEDFATLARQNSDDSSSVVGGGDLDWVNEGGMPPEMEQVIDTLEVNQLSEPYPSGTGWHIAEVMGRRTTDLSRQYASNQAENALRNRKFDLELQNWLIEIREEAFVEFIE